MDFRARTIHHQPNPSNPGTKHLTSSGADLARSACFLASAPSKRDSQKDIAEDPFVRLGGAAGTAPSFCSLVEKSAHKKSHLIAGGFLFWTSTDPIDQHIRPSGKSLLQFQRGPPGFYPEARPAGTYHSCPLCPMLPSELPTGQLRYQ